MLSANVIGNADRITESGTEHATAYGKGMLTHLVLVVTRRLPPPPATRPPTSWHPGCDTPGRSRGSYPEPLPSRFPMRMAIPIAMTHPARPSAQRACRALPRLGSPLWNPPSEAPPPEKGIPKGGNPSFSMRFCLVAHGASLGEGCARATVPARPKGSRPLRKPTAGLIHSQPLLRRPPQLGAGRVGRPANGTLAGHTSAVLHGVRVADLVFI